MQLTTYLWTGVLAASAASALGSGSVQAHHEFGCAGEDAEVIEVPSHSVRCTPFAKPVYSLQVVQAVPKGCILVLYENDECKESGPEPPVEGGRRGAIAMKRSDDNDEEGEGARPILAARGPDTEKPFIAAVINENVKAHKTCQYPRIDPPGIAYEVRCGKAGEIEQS